MLDGLLRAFAAESTISAKMITDFTAAEFFRTTKIRHHFVCFLLTLFGWRINLNRNGDK